MKSKPDIHTVIQHTDNLMVSGYAYTDSLPDTLASLLGCSPIDQLNPTHTVRLNGTYTVVPTAVGPKVCIDQVGLTHNNNYIRLNPPDLDMQMLIDDIECSTDFQAWIETQSQLQKDPS